MSSKSPEAIKVIEPKKGVRSKISKVWIVPAVALLLSFGLAFQQYSERDVTIRIDFPDASGIKEGKTELKFRKVKIGQVERIEFSDDLDRVQVFVNVSREMSHFIDKDARFWMVKPEISITKVSGLETLLTGDYIHAEWDAEPGETLKYYVAEEKAPLIAPGEEGVEIRLNAQHSKSIGVGGPILHKGVKVGKIKVVELSEDGTAVSILAFINTPYDQFINTGTRFWNASGVSIDVGTGGLNVKIESLTSILQGGIAFSTSISGGGLITPDTIFDLYPKETDAEDSILDDDLRATVHVSSLFTGSLKGLKIGTDVEYHGLKVGQVKNIAISPLLNKEGISELQLRVSYTIQPNRLGLTELKNKDETLEFLQQAVLKKGLRAQLAINSLLLGGLHIELVDDPDASPAELKLTTRPYATLPSIATPPETLKAAATNVLDRMAKLPVEELLDSVIKLVSDIDAIVVDKNTKKIPTEFVALIGNANDVVGSKDTKALPSDIRATLKQIRLILEDLRIGGATQNLNNTLSSANKAMSAIEMAAKDLPDLVEKLKSVSSTAKTTIASFGPGSTVYSKVSITIDDIDRTVRSLNSLIKLIERRPNSLLLGR